MIDTTKKNLPAGWKTSRMLAEEHGGTVYSWAAQMRNLRNELADYGGSGRGNSDKWERVNNTMIGRYGDLSAASPRAQEILLRRMQLDTRKGTQPRSAKSRQRTRSNEQYLPSGWRTARMMAEDYGGSTYTWAAWMRQRLNELGAPENHSIERIGYYKPDKGSERVLAANPAARAALLKLHKEDLLQNSHQQVPIEGDWPDTEALIDELVLSTGADSDTVEDELRKYSKTPGRGKGNNSRSR